jgi:predicted dehydrogenase
MIFSILTRVGTLGVQWRTMTRRQAAAVLASPAFAQSPADSRPLRLGLVGLVHGHIGGFLRRSLTRTDIQLAGVSEPKQDVASRYVTSFKFDPKLMYSSHERLLDEAKPEAVAVFTDTYDHRAVVEACARRGIHVMMEKPLAVSVEHGNAIAAAARKGNIHVLVNYETTWYPSNKPVWDIVKQQNALGPIRKMVVHDGHQGPKEIGVQPEFLGWLTDPERNGAGALYDFGCYGADLITWLMDGRRPTSVTAVTQQIKPEIYSRVDDEATIVLTYPGMQGIIQASWNWPVNRKDMEIYGRDGYIITSGPAGMRIRLPKTKQEEVREAGPLAQPEDDPLTYLRAVVRGQVKPSGLGSLEINLIANEILDAARKSAKTGRTIQLTNL